jgi:acyl-coenzyme A synthetase/AMP-(fatty) acid ligase
MTLCSATNDVMFRDIEEVIRNRNITHLSLTPTVAALIRPENVPKVRLLVTAGEGLTAKVHYDWADKGLYQGTWRVKKYLYFANGYFNNWF